MNGWSVCGYALLAIAACSGPPPRCPESPPLGEPSGSLAPGTKRRPTYLPAPRWVGANPGMIVGQARIGTLPTGALRWAPDGPEQPLHGGQIVRGGRDGDWVFWTSHSLYRAQGYFGPLQPLVTLPSRIERVAVGPQHLLVSTAAGRYSMHPVTGQLVAPPLLGLVDIAALADDRAMALLAGGRLLTSIDGGTSWTECEGVAAARVLTNLEQLWVVSLGGEALGLDRAGTLQPISEPRWRPVSDERWTVAASPLEHAMATGVPAGPGRALVVVGAAIARIDLATGRHEWLTEALSKTAVRCELVPIAPSLVLVCADEDGALELYAGLATPSPTRELRLAKGGILRAAGRILLFEGRCDGLGQQGTVCLRGPDGSWRQLDRRAEVRALAPDASVRAWLPRAGGGASAVVSRGDRREGWLLDGASGAARKLDAALVEALQWDPDASRIVDQSRVVTERGWLRGFDGKRFIALPPGSSRIQRPPAPRAQPVLVHGPRGFTIDLFGRAFQTLDWGEHWAEVEAPPRRIKFDQGRCSELGCDLGVFVRAGWPRHPPAPTHELPAPAEPPLAPAVARPELRCQALADLEGTVAPSEQAPDLVELGLGARVRLRHDSASLVFDRSLVLLRAAPEREWSLVRARPPLRASLITTSSPRAPTRGADPLRLWYLHSFDPRGRIHQGAGPAGRFAAERSWHTIPVLGLGRGRDHGLLVERADGLLWLGERRGSVRQLQARLDGAIQSAALTKTGELALLVAKEGQPATIQLLGTKPRKQALRRGAGSDSLGLADDGSVGVVRLPSSEHAPSEHLPALWMRPGHPVVALAPWSSLRPASSDECRGLHGGVRTLLQTEASLLEARIQGQLLTRPGLTEALVHWTPKQVCLEAVNLPLRHHSWHLGVFHHRLVARLAGAQAGSARLVVDLGVELRQRLECSLEGP